eukprot:2509171-Rhodomonas_salina.2
MSCQVTVILDFSLHIAPTPRLAYPGTTRTTGSRSTLMGTQVVLPGYLKYPGIPTRSNRVWQNSCVHPGTVGIPTDTVTVTSTVCTVREPHFTRNATQLQFHQRIDAEFLCGFEMSRSLAREIGHIPPKRVALILRIVALHRNVVVLAVHGYPSFLPRVQSRTASKTSVDPSAPNPHKLSHAPFHKLV